MEYEGAVAEPERVGQAAPPESIFYFFEKLDL